MQQVSQFLDGERDYRKIEGGTGPLVYPAAHVYIYTFLYWITDKGQNIGKAQAIFGMLYLVTLGVVMSCYRKAKVRSIACLAAGCCLLSRGCTGTAIRLPYAGSLQTSA